MEEPQTFPPGSMEQSSFWESNSCWAIQEISYFCESLILVSIFAPVCQCTLSWARRILSKTCISSRAISMLSSHLRLGPLNGLPFRILYQNSLHIPCMLCTKPNIPSIWRGVKFLDAVFYGDSISGLPWGDWRSDLGRIWKEAAVVQSRYVPARTEKLHEEPRSGWSVCSRGSNRVPPGKKSDALPLRKPARYGK